MVVLVHDGVPLAPREQPAVDREGEAAGDPSMPEGLTWAQLTQVTRTALRAGGCRGWSVGVYNADLDPDGRDAQRVVSYLAELATSAVAAPAG